MKQKHLVHLIIATLVILLFLTGTIIATDKKDKKRNPEPAVTVHELMIDYYTVMTGAKNSPPASGDVMQRTSTGHSYYTIGIDIPPNATITGLTMRAVMGHNYSSDNDRLITYLYRRNDYGDLVLVKLVKANYVAGNSNYRTKSNTFSVTATDQPYILVVHTPGTDLVTDIAYKCTWVKVTYTTP